MIEHIIGAIALILFFILIALVSIAAVSINHVRCPNCGSDMEYVGNDDTFNINKGLPKQLKHHYYICPKCGRTKIV